MEGSRSSELTSVASRVLEQFEETHRAREEALARCRETIRACSLAIRALHRRRTEDVSDRLSEAERGIREAQRALKPFPQLAAMGFLHDAEKEYAEARLTQALIGGDPLPVADELQVGLPAWLNGLAEAASELRRHLLDCLRAGDVEQGRATTRDHGRGLRHARDRRIPRCHHRRAEACCRRSPCGGRAIESRRDDYSAPDKPAACNRVSRLVRRRRLFAGLTEDGIAACILPRAGGVAQLVERYVRNVEVGGSSPLTSTNSSMFEPRSRERPGFSHSRSRRDRKSSSRRLLNGCANRV